MRGRYLYVFAVLSVCAAAAFGQSERRALGAQGLDARFVALTHQVPGFGGYFFDANGDLNVYLTDLSYAEAARAAVAEAARQRPERPSDPWKRPAEIVIRHGDFDFLQLDEWHERMSAAAAIEGVQWLDTDEDVNRLYIGVTTETARTRALELAEKLGVPHAAVVVEIVPEATLISNLRNYYRPLIGGLEINFTLDNIARDCTLGVNVWYSNLANGVPVGTRGFYTAAHCSGARGTTDGMVYRQGGAQIGHEMYDAPFFTNARNSRCPGSGYLCRWSDVTFVAYDAGVNRHQGRIAQTLYRGFGPGWVGSLEINSSTPEFILNQTALPVEGSYFEKVGRTTGWTAGRVVHTCIDYYQPGQAILCQDEVEAEANSGDSGSPVFYWTSQTTAAFSGIAWLRTNGGNFVFSNLDRIAADMGTGVTYTP